MNQQKFQISSQYLKTSRIAVTILYVHNPAHFVVRESPTLDASNEAKHFIEAEDAMQKYYKSIDPGFFQLPLKDSIVVVLFKDKFYRAKVVRILIMSAGHLFRVYLVDYGIECSVERNCIYEIEKDFLAHPFQAVDFKLLGVEPITLVMDSIDLNFSYGPVSYWDPSADTFVADLQKGMCSAYIEVQAIDKENIFGKLFMGLKNNVTRNLSEELISNRFAQYNENLAAKVQSIGNYLETGDIDVKTPATVDGNVKMPESVQGNVEMSETVNENVKMPATLDGNIMPATLDEKIMPATVDENIMPVTVNVNVEMPSPVESISCIESNPKQVSSPSQIETDLFSCKMMFVRPSDGKIISQSCLVEDTSDMQGDLLDQGATPSSCNKVCDSKFEQKTLSPFKATERMSVEKVSQYSTSPSSLYDKTSEVQNVVAQKRFLKLRKSYEYKLKSSEHLNENCVSSENVSSASKHVKEDTTDSINSNGFSNESAVKNNENNIRISPSKLNVTLTNHDPSRSYNVDCEERSIESSPKENDSESQVIAQQRLLKLQQRYKKKLQTCNQINNTSTRVDSSSANTQAYNSFALPSTSDSPKDSCNLSNLQCSNQSDKSASHRIERNYSCSSKSSSCSSSLSDISALTSSEKSPRQETSGSEESIIHKRFLKLQQRYRKKSESTVSDKDTDSLNVHNLHSGNRNEENGRNIPPGMCSNVKESPSDAQSISTNSSPSQIQSSQDVILNTCVQKPADILNTSDNCKPASKGINERQDKESEVTLNHIKRFQKLQNRFRSKLVKETSLETENGSNVVSESAPICSNTISTQTLGQSISPPVQSPEKLSKEEKSSRDQIQLKEIQEFNTEFKAQSFTKPVKKPESPIKINKISEDNGNKSLNLKNSGNNVVTKGSSPSHPQSSIRNQIFSTSDSENYLNDIYVKNDKKSPVDNMDV